MPTIRIPALSLALLPAIAAPQGSPAGCNAPASDPIVNLTLPGNPFTALPTPDGCWVFVAMGGPDAPMRGVAVVRRAAGRLTLERTVPLRANGTGAALTHDGRTLIVAAATSVAVLDVERMKSGAGDPVRGYLDVGDGTGVIYAGVTSDDALLFVALERAQSILVVNLPKLLGGGGAIDPSAVIGRIPVGTSPVAVTPSKDGRRLYSTTQAALPSWGWPVECRPEADQAAPPNHAKGAIVVADIQRARTDPANSVIARVPVGCNPVRLVLTPDERTIWVSTRGDHAIVAVDTRTLIDDPAHAVVARLGVGTAPVGVAVAAGGRMVISTNSNRFAGGADDRQSLNVVDASGGPASARLLGTIPAGAFPRELRVSEDGNTLFASNFGSRTLQMVDLRRLSAAMTP